MNKKSNKPVKTYKIHDTEHSNLKEINPSDKNYLFFKEKRASKQNIAALVEIVKDRSKEYDIYFATIVFEDISRDKQHEYINADSFSNFFKFISMKIGSVIQRSPKECIVEMMLFPEESFHQPKSFQSCPKAVQFRPTQHYHGVLFIKKSFGKIFKEKCVLGIRQVETSLGMKDTYDLQPKILNPDNPLKVKDYRIHPITTEKEYVGIVKYIGKGFANPANKFGWDDIILTRWAPTLRQSPVRARVDE